MSQIESKEYVALPLWQRALNLVLTKEKDNEGFGTFKGVYIPSVLTIFGVIMYLRLGWVVGQVGIFGTVLIVTMASLITFLTALSIAATATNMKVGVGGAYYMISRSFGVEMGAAIGIPLFFAQALGVSFYVSGFAESVHSLLPIVDQRVYSSLVLLVLAWVAYRSADLALKTQLLIFIVILISIASFFIGAVDYVEAETIAVGDPVPILSFWAVFAVFFPAVTGIEAGIALSGDLKNPSKSLPWGTILAVVSGFLMYLAIPIVLYQVVSEETLLKNFMVMKDVAAVGSLVLLGLWGATLSSALGALLGAPRTLQSLAKDRVVFGFLAKGYGPRDEPRIATAFSFLIAMAAVLLGDIDSIAPILTMFFLTSYGFLNLAAGLEGFMQNPSWRPKFVIPWPVSIAGAFACGATMLMIDSGATFLATIFVILIFFVTKSRRLGSHWLDMRRGIFLTLARYAIYETAKFESDARSWRPNVMVLSGAPTKRWYLIEIADALTHGKGFLTVGTIVSEKLQDGERLISLEKSIKEFLWKRNVPALVEVRSSEEPLEGAADLVRHYGLGNLVPNTIILGDTENDEDTPKYANLIRQILKLRKNVMIVCRPKNVDPEGVHMHALRKGARTIDVWWGRQRQNANLMIALAYMLQNSPEWRGSDIYLKSTIRNEDERKGATESLVQFLEDGRLPVSPVVLEHKPEKDVFSTICRNSQNADLTLLGMRAPEDQETDEQYGIYFRKLMEKTKDLPAAAFVIAAEPIKFSEIFS